MDKDFLPVQTTCSGKHAQTFASKAPKPTLGDKSNAQTQSLALPHGMPSRAHSGPSRATHQGKVHVYKDIVSAKGQQTEPPTIVVTRSKATKLPTTLPSTKTESTSSAGVPTSNKDPIEPKRAFKPPTSSTAFSPLLDAPSLPEGSQAKGRQQGMYASGTFAVDSIEQDLALLADYSSISAVEGTSSMLIEDSNIQASAIGTEENELPDAMDVIADSLGSGTNRVSRDVLDQGEDMKRTRSASVPFDAVEPIRGRKRKEEHESDPLVTEDTAKPSKLRSVAPRKRILPRANRRPDPLEAQSPPASSPASPQRRARPSRGINAARRKRGGKSNSNSEHDDGGLAESLQRRLFIRTEEAHEKPLREVAVPGHDGYVDDGYSSPPSHSSTKISEAISSVEHNHHAGKKAMRGAGDPKGTRRAGGQGDGSGQSRRNRAPMPTKVYRTAPALGDSDSSDDPMAI